MRTIRFLVNHGLVPSPLVPEFWLFLHVFDARRRRRVIDLRGVGLRTIPVKFWHCRRPVAGQCKHPQLFKSFAAGGSAFAAP